MKYLFPIGVIVVIILIALTHTSSPPGTQIAGPMETAGFYPEATNYAVDPYGYLNEGELASLNKQLESMDSEKHQFGVAVVRTTSPLTIEEYGIKLAEKWKVGKAGLDNGAIIILAVEDRKVRIEVGKGLEGDIPDSKAGRIIDNVMVGALKESRWYDAISEGLVALGSEINK